MVDPRREGHTIDEGIIEQPELIGLVLAATHL